jgi:fatty-acyl-CoA synthase
MTDTPSFAPLTPLAYLQRSARVWADQVAVRFGDDSTTYHELLGRVQAGAGALRGAGLAAGERVAVLLPNVPAMLELQFAVPGAGGVLVPINTRLGPGEIAFILEHSGARFLIAHDLLRAVALDALAGMPDPPRLIVAGAASEDQDGYDHWLERAEPVELVRSDEHALLSINYTSGTTGRPKGVMYVHRGAYLHALGVIAEARLSPASRYLWTLPMFHCNGWAFPWAVTAMGARHVCLEAVEPAAVWRLLDTEGITHMCCAPTVLTMLLESAEAAPLPQRVEVFVGGAPPSPALLERAGALGFHVVHLYGLTETYGPIAVCAWRPSWDELPTAEQAHLVARQGVGTVVSEHLRVVNDRMCDVPADGRTLGEVVMRGNNVMAGYYRDEEATAAAFAGGWLHSGDLGVLHPDGYVELRDRAKDIVITGGENVSTIEVEQALAAHPDVVEAAVVGTPDQRWGEVVKAFVVLRGEQAVPAGMAEELQRFVRGRLAGFKVPRQVVFCDELPKTATGKLQKYLLRQQDAEDRRVSS